MKKLLVVVIVLMVSLTGLYANGRGDLTTIEGTLIVQDSIPAVETKDGLWMLPPGPFYRIAWENDISRGDTLVVRGFTEKERRSDSDEFVGRIMPVEVQVNGETIEIDDPGRVGRRGMGPDGREDCGPAGDRGPRGGFQGRGPSR